MGQWVSSKEFALTHNMIQNSLQKACARHFKKNHFFCKIIGKYFPIKYLSHSGKVLKIWSEPFATEEEAQAFINGDCASAKSTALLENVEDFSKAGIEKQNLALNKEHIIKQWEKAKRRGISARSFIESINAGLDSINLHLSPKLLPLSENKLYAWQRAYKEKGLLGLLDKRGSKRESSIKTLGIEPLVVELLEARRGSINISSLHNILHMKLDSMGIFDYKTYIAKEGEYVSYTALMAYVKEWKQSNPLKTKLILKGEDSAIGSFMPAFGVSNYKASSINQVVEIDATRLDAIISVDKLKELGIEAAQECYVLISLIDTYSGVCSFHLSDTENSLGVARAVAKYISLYGKPEKIKGDNGSAFVSKYAQEVMARLGIEYERAPAYSGWCKPYIETNFKSLQNALIEWLSGYIGHSVSQRQAIEFLFSRQQRRLKKGQKTYNLKLMGLRDMQKAIDDYTHILNNRFLDRLQGSPINIYNAISDKAVALNAYELTLRLAPLQTRKVNKKGIAYNNGFFAHPSLGGLNNVFVANNINDDSELFVFDEKKEFLCIAKSNALGVSAEEAKAAQKNFKKALKQAKEELIASRAKVEHMMPELVASVATKLQKPKALKQPRTNTVLQKEILIKEGRALNTDAILKISKQIKNKEKTPKRDYSFEAAILKKEA